MFTGIVEGLASVVDVRPLHGGVRLCVETELHGFGDLALGDSVAVCGCCLSVVACEPTGSGSVRLSFDMIAETLDKTWFNGLAVGCQVNLERALVLGARLDGHLVQGHVDGVAVLRERTEVGADVRMVFAAGPELTGNMIHKGSIAIDGVSLTLTDVSTGSFAVALIPHTLAITSLGHKAIGDAVNIETDMLGKWFRQLMQPYVDKLAG